MSNNKDFLENLFDNFLKGPTIIKNKPQTTIKSISMDPIMLAICPIFPSEWIKANVSKDAMGNPIRKTSLPKPIFLILDIATSKTIPNRNAAVCSGVKRPLSESPSNQTIAANKIRLSKNIPITRKISVRCPVIDSDSYAY